MAASNHDNQDDCVCFPGFFGPSGGPCSPCPRGTFKNTLGGATGTSSDCSVCSSTAYSMADGSTTCTACPANTQAPGVIADDHDSVADCMANPGFFGTSLTTIVQCPAGSFKTWTGGVEFTSNDCTVCDDNTYSSQTGRSTACTGCPANTVTHGAGVANHNSVSKCVCAPGFYGTGGLQPCTTCPAGSYNTQVGGTDAGSCLPCSGNTYSTATGLSQPCSSQCPPHSVIVDLLCEPGYYLLSGACTACPQGTFKPFVGGHLGVADCQPCPALNALAAGQTSCPSPFPVSANCTSLDNHVSPVHTALYAGTLVSMLSSSFCDGVAAFSSGWDDLDPGTGVGVGKRKGVRG
jgi:hypothetical protein